MTEFGELLAAEAVPSPRITRQKVLLLCSGILLLICVPIALFSWAAAESATSLLLIGNATGFQIGLVAGMIAVGAFVVLLWNVSPSGWWLIVAIPCSVGAGLLLALGLVVLPVTAVEVTPIVIDGCASGYVAIEPFAGVGSFVGVRDGIHVDKVHEYWADEFGMPFSSGTVSVLTRNGVINVTYPGGSGFDLPMLAAASCTE